MLSVLRIRALLPAALLLMMTAGVLLIVPEETPWQHVSAEAPPKTAPGDRFFLKLDGIEGEATETGHNGELALRSFSWSQTRTDVSVKVQAKDFHAVMAFDTSSPALLRKNAVRERSAKAVLFVRNAIGQDYLKWTMSDVIVAMVQVEGTAGAGKPLVTFDLNVGKIDLEYRPQLYNGGLGPAVKAGWEAR